MYSFDSKIRYTECDMEGFLTIESLVDYFQDCSTFQTQLGPATMEAMAKKGLAWVINSWQIVINRLPRLGDDVVIGTVPYQLKGFIGCRNFFMRTSDGENLAVANSVWALINLEKGTPGRIDDSIIATYPLDEKLPMDYAPRKISTPENGSVYIADEKRVGMHHLDTNNHVNNGQYIRIALQAAAQVAEREHNKELDEICKMRENLQIRVEYKQQAHLGDEIYPTIYETSDDSGEKIYVISLDDGDKKPYSIVELKRIKEQVNA